MLVKQNQAVEKSLSVLSQFEFPSSGFGVDAKLETQDPRLGKKDRRGFTLVEVIVILVVIGILAAVAVPVALRVFERTAEEATREEMDNLKMAIVGDARKLQGSFRSDFGFLGDIGCLPTDLEFLLNRTVGATTLPLWSFDTAKQTGAGWKGPYITGAAVGEETEEYTEDQLGNDYTYTPSSTPSATCPLDATLTSNGPDGTPGTADDITLAILANETTATVRGSVKDSAGDPVAGVSVDFNYPSEGTLSTVTPVTDSNGNYAVVGAPFGPRSVQTAAASLALVPGSINVTGGAHNNVDFQVTNYSGSAVTVTSINVTCPGAVTDYRDIEFDNQQVDPNGEEPCGADTGVGGGNTVFSANPVPPAPLRVFVNSPDVLLPDLTIGGGGATRTIEIQDFENGNSNFDMRGQTLTVTFTLSSGGTAIVTFTTPP